MVLRPAAAVGVALELLLGGEQAAGAVGDDMALEVGLAAEQPEAVLDLPFDRGAGPSATGASRDRLRWPALRRDRPAKIEKGGQSRKG